MRYPLFPCFVLASVGLTVAAGAQQSTDRSLAQSLFEQAKELMALNRYAEACPKLEESQRLDPGGGTLLNLGLCHEKEGKIAAAWSDFKEALGLARRDGRAERIQAAEERIAALEPQLPWLTLTVMAPVQGEVILLDGVSLGQAAWGTPIAMDPGRHQLSASAPEYKSWSVTLALGVGEKMTASVPALEAAESTAPRANELAGAPQRAVHAAPPPSPATLPTIVQPRDRTLAWILGGAGVAAIGAGVFFGVQAVNKRHDSDGQCPTDTTCTPQGVTWNDQAKTAALISDIGIGVGILSVGVSALLFSSGSVRSESPGQAASKLSVRANAAPNAGQISVRGRW